MNLIEQLMNESKLIETVDIKLSDYFNSNIEQSDVYESDEFPAFPDGSPALVYDGEEWQVSAGASWDDDNVIEIAAMTYDAIDSGDVIEGENLLSKTFSVDDKDAAVEYFNELLGKADEAIAVEKSSEEKFKPEDDSASDIRTMKVKGDMVTKFLDIDSVPCDIHNAHGVSTHNLDSGHLYDVYRMYYIQHPELDKISVWVADISSATNDKTHSGDAFIAGFYVYDTEESYEKKKQWIKKNKDILNKLVNG